MADRHLNLFYTYNRDAELIENNLTRAFIVTLRGLSPQTRGRLLSSLLSAEGVKPSGVEKLDLYHAQFALQDRIDRGFVNSCLRKWIVTISSHQDPTERIEGTREFEGYGSIPDAWIFSPKGEYCFLVEAKVGSNPIDMDQVSSHAATWLDIDGVQQLNEIHIGFTWGQIADEIVQVLAPGIDTRINQQERFLMEEFLEFLGFFGHRTVRGIRFDGLKPIGAPVLFGIDQEQMLTDLLSFNRLVAPPEDRICRMTE